MKYSVTVDEASGCYIVTSVNTDEEAQKQIKVIYFNQDHEIISTTYFAAPNASYEYCDLIDYCINSDKKVVVIAKGVQKKNEELLVGILKKGDNTFRIRKPSFIKGKELETAIIKYRSSQTNT